MARLETIGQMDWDRYKALCDTPDVCSRWLLEETVRLLGPARVAACLRAALADAPLPKPHGHRGDSDTDMLRLSLSLSEVRDVRRRVETARAAGATTRAGRDLGGFVEAWRDYERHLTLPQGGQPLVGR